MNWFLAKGIQTKIFVESQKSNYSKYNNLRNKVSSRISKTGKKNLLDWKI